MSSADLLMLQAQSQSAKNQMKFQERMSNTAHQREVKDLQAAGLNPVLSSGGSGASTPNGAAGDLTGLDLSRAIGGLVSSSAGSAKTAQKLTENVTDLTKSVNHAINKMGQFASGQISESKIVDRLAEIPSVINSASRAFNTMFGKEDENKYFSSGSTFRERTGFNHPFEESYDQFFDTVTNGKGNITIKGIGSLPLADFAKWFLQSSERAGMTINQRMNQFNSMMNDYFSGIRNQYIERGKAISHFFRHNLGSAERYFYRNTDRSEWYR